jgi:hypothetical protein
LVYARQPHLKAPEKESFLLDTFKIPHILSLLVLLFVQFPSTDSSLVQQTTSNPLSAGSAVLSHTVVEPGYVYDEFKKIEIKETTDTDDTPYWWIINNEGGAQIYDNCSEASCITQENEQSLKYARLQLVHHTMPVWDDQNYIGTEISEYRTMYSSGLTGYWLPTEDHPVTVSARVRFSSNYEQDGTGGAVGTAGLWLWNSYPDLQTYAPAYAFGFNWAETGVAGDLEGLRMTALQGTIPVYNEPLNISVDMSEWHDWKLEWSVDNTGTQSIEWRLDNTLVGETTLEEPFEALSLTFWNDNQFPTFIGGSEYTVVMHNPASAQNFDIDWAEIEQSQ